LSPIAAQEGFCRETTIGATVMPGRDPAMDEYESEVSMNRQKQIQLTPAEQTEFLRHTPKGALATIDQDGFPHVVAMGFMMRDGNLYMTSYRKAQKVLNIQRNPKVAVMIETGQKYAEFRGVMIRGICEIIDDPKTVAETIAGMPGAHSGVPAGAVSSAPKRVVLKIVPRKISSWDHSKLGGRY
jgi:nitroimidazol reductase NimA-like FMN-containing flavoprotein (pyridoxamine 5'-phosphate oxidase superfamily)